MEEPVVSSRADCHCLPLSVNNTESTSECNPGDYIIENGVLKFLTTEDFIETIDFLNCGDGASIYEWENNIPIETPGKIYAEFMSNFCSDNSLSDADLDQLLIEYDGQINYEWVSDEEINISPIFETHERFRNMNGYFMIGDKIEGEVGNYRIVVYDGNWQKLNVLISNPNFPQDSTLYDGDSTLVVTDRHIGFGDPCCDNTNEDEQFYNAGDDDRRLTIGYLWLDISNYDQNTKMAVPMISTRRTGELRRKNIVGRWTRCVNRHWDEKLKVDWWVVPTTTIVNSQVGGGKLVNSNNSSITSWGCDYSLSKNFRSGQIGPFEERPNPIACVFDISYDVEIWTGECAAQETTFTVECSNYPPPVCKECPAGWIYDSSYRRCKTDIYEYCVIEYIWRGGLYYRDDNEQCNYGGVFNGVDCYLGHLPAGWEDDGIIDDGCIYLRPHCK